MAQADSRLPTNIEVIDVYKQKGVDQCVQWLSTYSTSSTETAIKISISRLWKTYQHKNKSRSKPTGLCSLNEWSSGTYKFPDSHNLSHSNVSTPVSSITSTSPLTRHSCLTLDSELAETTTKLECVTEQLSAVSDERDSLETKLGSLKTDLKRTSSRELYYRHKVAKLENLSSNEKIDILNDELASAELEIHELKHKHVCMAEEIKRQNELISDLQNQKDIDTFDHSQNAYHSKFRQLVYHLLEHHVGTEHISPVIDAVINYTGHKASRLPSPKTIQNMNIERLGLSQLHLGDALKDKTHTTLYSDETSKYGEKYMGFHASDEDHRYWVLGVRYLATKSADDTFAAFQEILQDIDDRRGTTTSSVGKTILTNITNTMSDRAATELKWHQLLENYRQNILPEVIPHWSELEEVDRLPVETLNNFFCGLHSFVQIAEVTQSAILQLERSVVQPQSGPQIIKASEPGSVRLIRTAAKSFARGGDEKSGCYGDFKIFVHDFLKQHSMNTIPIVPFRGNRFNIIFFNGAVTYFLHKQMIEYLEGKGNLNLLQKAVLNDLREPFYIAGCKALGLVCKQVTAPLWRITENKSIHVLEMTHYITDLIEFLERASTNLPDFMSGTLTPSDHDEWVVKQDMVFESLTTPSPYDENVEEILGVVLPAITSMLKSHYSEFLDGGAFNTPSNELKRATKSVEKHNKFSERVFAYTDQLLRFKPNITHITQESYIMFSLNHTREWLMGKSSKDQDELIKRSRKDARVIAAKYKERKEKIRETRQKIQKEKREEEEKRKAKKQKERELMFQDVLYYGFYQKTEQVDECLCSIRGKKEKEDALKAQIRFRQHILGQEADAGLFKFSEKVGDDTRHNRSVAELAENVKELIRLAQQLPITEEDESRVSSMIRRRLQHILCSDGQLVTYKAVVISSVPGYPTWFNIKYDDDDAIYVEELNAEIAKGNIKLL